MTVLLEFNSKQKVAKSLLQVMLDSGFVKIKGTPDILSSSAGSVYNPEYVKKIKAAQVGPKTRLTPKLEKKLFG